MQSSGYFIQANNCSFHKPCQLIQEYWPGLWGTCRHKRNEVGETQLLRSSPPQQRKGA